ncbi:MAG: hypothetical protein EKK55_23085 [Rhodocyclaceae bacterium]|nr:MAG: hypothetical protein EKK55_23085 [Rhodocyclaceae bacterium]
MERLLGQPEQSRHRQWSGRSPRRSPSLSVAVAEAVTEAVAVAVAGAVPVAVAVAVAVAGAGAVAVAVAVAVAEADNRVGVLQDGHRCFFHASPSASRVNTTAPLWARTVPAGSNSVDDVGPSISSPSPRVVPHRRITDAFETVTSSPSSA